MAFARIVVVGRRSALPGRCRRRRRRPPRRQARQGSISISSLLLTLTRSPPRRGRGRARRAVQRAPHPGLMGRRRRRSRSRPRERRSSFEANACPLLRQLLGGSPCLLLTGGALSRPAAGEVGLDEVAGQARRYGRAGAMKTSERLNFARRLRVVRPADVRARYASACRAWRRCGSGGSATVRSPRNSAAATSRFVWPGATRTATRRSAAVRPSSRAAADAPELAARLLAQVSAAEVFKGVERPRDRVARGSLLPLFAGGRPRARAARAMAEVVHPTSSCSSGAWSRRTPTARRRPSRGGDETAAARRLASTQSRPTRRRRPPRRR